MLQKIREELQKRGIDSCITKSKTPKETICYVLLVSRKKGLLELLKKLKLRHKDKIKRLNLALNVIKNKLTWKQVEPAINKLRKEIECQEELFQKNLMNQFMARRLEWRFSLNHIITKLPIIQSQHKGFNPSSLFGNRSYEVTILLSNECTYFMRLYQWKDLNVVS